MATVGERVKEERLMRGWSQRDLAQEAKTTAETVSSIETGLHQPRPSTLRKLAGALGLEVRDLFQEPALAAGKAKAPATGLDVADLPGLEAALRRRGMGRGELAHRAGMTPGELFDYEVGEKKPNEEIVRRIAEALGCFNAELVFPPDRAEAFLEGDQQQNAVIRDKRDEWLQEMREERLRNPAVRRTDEAMKEAYDAADEERRASEADRRRDDAVG